MGARTVVGWVGAYRLLFLCLRSMFRVRGSAGEIGAEAKCAAAGRLGCADTGGVAARGCEPGLCGEGLRAQKRVARQRRRRGEEKSC